MNLFQIIKMKLRPSLTCQQVNEFIVDYLEDRLPHKTRIMFEKHLAMCPSCVPFFDQYNQTVELIREEGKIDIPPDLAEHTMAFLKQQLDKED